MDPEITALPTGDTAAAGEQAQTTQAAADQTNAQQAEAKPEGQEGEQTTEQKEAAAKKEKTPEQREIERLRRRVDNLTRQKYEARAQAQQPEQRQQGTQASDDEPVTLSKADLDRMIEERAAQRAPSIAEQRAEAERRSGIVKTLEKTWGKDEFDAKASDLDDVFGGLADRSGKPKPATDAIFDSDDPKAVIEYLTDPDNADEAERISRLPAAQAGRAIAKLEAKLEAEKKAAKAKPSNAASPIASVKGGGVPKGMPDPSNTKAWIAWRNAEDNGR